MRGHDETRHPSRHRCDLEDRVALGLIATVARMVRDLDLAEELAQDALVSASWSSGRVKACRGIPVHG